MLIKVFSVEQASSRGVLEGATGLLNKGEGSNRLPGLVTIHQWMWVGSIHVIQSGLGAFTLEANSGIESRLEL